MPTLRDSWFHALVTFGLVGLAAAGSITCAHQEWAGDEAVSACPGPRSSMTEEPDLRRYLGARGTITGVARNGKGNAAIQLADGTIIYVASMMSWPETVEDKCVTMTGPVERRTLMTAGENEVWLLPYGSWRLVK